MNIFGSVAEFGAHFIRQDIALRKPVGIGALVHLTEEGKIAKIEKLLKPVSALFAAGKKRQGTNPTPNVGYDYGKYALDYSLEQRFLDRRLFDKFRDRNLAALGKDTAVAFQRYLTGGEAAMIRAGTHPLMEDIHALFVPEEKPKRKGEPEKEPVPANPWISFVLPDIGPIWDDDQFNDEAAIAVAKDTKPETDGDGQGATPCVVFGEGFGAPKRLLTTVNKAENLCSFNRECFEFYGKTQNFNAPISDEADKALAMGWLKIVELGGSTVNEGLSLFYWPTPRPGMTDDEIRDIMSTLGEVLKVRFDPTGQNFTLAFETYRDYEINVALCKVERNGRSRVLSFDRASIRDLADQWEQHRVDLFGPKTQRRFKLGVSLMLRVRAKPSKDDGKLETKLAAQIVRAIAMGDPYPIRLADDIMARFKKDGLKYGDTKTLVPGLKDGTVTAARLSILTAVLNRASRFDPKNYKGVPYMLSKTNTDLGYVTGRLIATVEHLYRAINEDNRKRDFSTDYLRNAQVRPMAVISKLNGNVGHYAAVVRRKNGGTAGYCEKVIGEILDLLNPVDTVRALTATERMNLHLGYAHQRSMLRFKLENASPDENMAEEEKGSIAA